MAQTQDPEPIDDGFVVAVAADLPKTGRTGAILDVALAQRLAALIERSEANSIKSTTVYHRDDETSVAAFKTDSARIKAHLLTIYTRDMASLRMQTIPGDGDSFTYAIIKGEPRKPRESKTTATE